MDVKFDVILQQVREGDGESGLEPTVNRHTAQIAQHAAELANHESRIAAIEQSPETPELIKQQFAFYHAIGEVNLGTLAAGDWKQSGYFPLDWTFGEWGHFGLLLRFGNWA